MVYIFSLHFSINVQIYAKPPKLSTPIIRIMLWDALPSLLREYATGGRVMYGIELDGTTFSSFTS